MENLTHVLVNIASIIGAGTFLYYLIIFTVLTLCGLGLPVPEDIVLIAAGVFVYQQHADLTMMILVSLLGVIVGDYMIFYIGRRWGVQFLNHAWLRDIFTDKRIAKVHHHFDHYGNKFVFFARFIWGLRAVTFFIAGTHTMSAVKFILLDLLGAIISIPLIIYIAFRFGGKIEKAFSVIEQTNHAILLILGLSVVFFVAKHYYLKRKQNS